jgi:hypothetical protein
MKKISRNSFIKRLTTFTLGLINLPLIKYINPLIKKEIKESIKYHIYATGSAEGFQLHCDNPYTYEVIPRTYREIILEHIEIENPSDDELGEILENEYFVDREALDEEGECEVDLWDSCPTTKPVHDFLRWRVFLNDEMLGQFDFIEGPHPGSNYTAVHTPDEETLSELKDSLGKLKIPTEITYL